MIRKNTIKEKLRNGQVAIGCIADSLGHTGNADHPIVRDTIATTVRLISEAGRWAQLAPRSLDPAEARRCADLGAQILLYHDAGFLRQRVGTLLRDVRAAIV